MRESQDGNIRKLIGIGQISSLFGLLILSLRHFLVAHAHDYFILLPILTAGFLPSWLLYRRLPRFARPYLLIVNALLLVSLVFGLMGEWALSGVFILVPVFSLLFKQRKVYLSASVASFAVLAALGVLRLFQPGPRAAQLLVNLLDSGTVFLILVFIIYFIVSDLLRQVALEARNLQTILALTRSVEARDLYTRGHSDRVARLGRLIAERLPEADPAEIYNSGLIHDVGKLGVPDSILLKPARLTNDELEVIKRHPTEGAEICVNLGMPQSLIDGVLYHHERWDGAGYPHRLAGSQIPLVGRILCIADSLDAMASHRAYRPAFPVESVRNELERGAGSQFDPRIAAIALEHWQDVRALLELAESGRSAPVEDHTQTGA
jgi:hypothetical protein